MSVAFFEKNGKTAADYAERCEHGTRARFQLGKCRCLPCRSANAEYEAERLRANKGPWRMSKRGRTARYHVRNVDTGEVDLRTEIASLAKRRVNFLNKRDGEPAENQLVSTAPAIRHIAFLRTKSVGLKTVALRSGVAYSVVERIVSGKIKRSRRCTIEAILGVLPIARGRAKIDATETWRLLDDLIARGWTKGWIAQQLGSKTPALQIKRDRVTGESARRVRELHARLEGCFPAARALGTRWEYRPPPNARTPDDPVQPKPEGTVHVPSRVRDSPEYKRRIDQVFRDLL